MNDALPPSAVIIPAAGAGERMGFDKVSRPLCGIPVIVRTARVFLELDAVRRLIIAAHPERVDALAQLLADHLPMDMVSCVPGGVTRTDSVRHALDDLPDNIDLVAVHDCARPLVSAETVAAALATVGNARIGAVVAHRMTDTVKRADESLRITGTLDRHELWRAATPQVFPRDVLVDAYARRAPDAPRATDDAQLVERLSIPVICVESNPENIKLTTPFDWRVAESLLSR